jgi:DNA repair ATPase RecN
MSDRDELTALSQRVDGLSELEKAHAMNTAQLLTSQDAFRNMVNTRFDRAENRFDRIENRLDRIENRMDAMAEDIRAMREEMRTTNAQMIELLTRLVGKDAN